MSYQSGELTKLFCSFCGKDQHEVKHLVQGQATQKEVLGVSEEQSVMICDTCIPDAAEIVRQAKMEAARGKSGVPAPANICAVLDDHVISQDKAKRILSVAVHNHYKRLKVADADLGVELSKSNIMLVGPTGSGKTLLAETLARVADVPFAMADATSLTQAGYVGGDVEDIVQKLLVAADYDVEKAQQGIVYIDEIDKISAKGGKLGGGGRDVSGEGVQQALLKMIEGTVVSVSPNGGDKGQEKLQVDTRNILFIIGGAFAGLDKVIAARTKGNAGIGFNAAVSGPDERKTGEVLAGVEPEDLVQFGMIPEFVGRVPIIAPLKDLDESALVRILTEPKNALVKQYKHLFELEGVTLEFTDDALKAVADQAIIRETGARGLRSIMENLLLETMYDLPGRTDVQKVVVTGEHVREGTKPELVLGGSNDNKSAPTVNQSLKPGM